MTLYSLGEEYQAAARALRERIRQLRKQADEAVLTETERVLLCRRISTLISMARDTASTGRYLKNYYGKDDRCVHE